MTKMNSSERDERPRISNDYDDRKKTRYYPKHESRDRPETGVWPQDNPEVERAKPNRKSDHLYNEREKMERHPNRTVIPRMPLPALTLYYLFRIKPRPRKPRKT